MLARHSPPCDLCVWDTRGEESFGRPWSFLQTQVVRDCARSERVYREPSLSRKTSRVRVSVSIILRCFNLVKWKQLCSRVNFLCAEWFPLHLYSCVTCLGIKKTQHLGIKKIQHNRLGKFRIVFLYASRFYYPNHVFGNLSKITIHGGFYLIICTGIIDR